MRLAALAVALVATTLSAATGPEIAVSAPTVAEAAFSQSDPAVASNGSDYFAIWRDERSSSETSGNVSLYGSRVDANGKFAQPFGVRLADNVYQAAITSSGRGYLVVFSQYTGPTFAYRINDDGTILQPSVTISNDHYIYAVATTGNGYLALLSDAGSIHFWALFLDSSGVPRGPEIDLGQLWHAALVAAGSDYRIADLQWTCDGQTPCIVKTRLTSLNSSTRAVSQKIIGPEVPQSTTLNAIASDRIFITLVTDGDVQTNMHAERSVSMETVDFDGNVIDAPRVIATGPAACFCGWARASLAINGSEILVGWPRMRTNDGVESNSKIVALRVRPDLSPIDAQPFDVTDAIATSFVAATSANGILLLSSEQRHLIRPYYYAPPDVFARAVRSFSELAGPHAEDAIVEASAAEFESAVATSASRAIVAWREFDQPSAIRASVIEALQSTVVATETLAERSNVTREGVSVAILRDAALVVWREETDQGIRVLAKRMSLDGVVLDESSIVVGETAAPYLPPGITSVATDGRQFFVVWNADQDVFGVRLLADGTVVDHEPIQISREAVPHFHFRIDPRIVWSGTMFIVMWSDDPRPPSLVSPPLPPQTIVREARVTPAGAVLDSIESATLISSFGGIAKVSLAANGDTVMAVYSADDQGSLMRCAFAMPLDRDGQRQTTNTSLITCDPFKNSSDTPLELAVTATADRFTVFWASSARGEVRGSALSATGVAGPPFIVSPPGEIAWRPAAAPIFSGTFTTYTRIAPEPQYGRVPRVFGRLVDAETPPKHRAVKH